MPRPSNTTLCCPKGNELKDIDLFNYQKCEVCRGVQTRALALPMWLMDRSTGSSCTAGTLCSGAEVTGWLLSLALPGCHTKAQMFIMMALHPPKWFHNSEAAHSPKGLHGPDKTNFMAGTYASPTCVQTDQPMLLVLFCFAEMHE